MTDLPNWLVVRPQRPGQGRFRRSCRLVWHQPATPERVVYGVTSDCTQACPLPEVARGPLFKRRAVELIRSPWGVDLTLIEVLTVLLAHDPSVTIPCAHAVEAVVVTRCAARTGAGKAGGRGARAEEVREGGAGRDAGGGKGKGGSKGSAIHPVGLLVKPKGRLLQEAFRDGGRTRRAHALREMARKYLPLRSCYSSVLVTAIAGLCVGLLNVPLSLLARRGWGSKAVAFTTAASVTAALALYWQAIWGTQRRANSSSG